MSATETKGIALITGASSGIGAVYADRLVRAAPPELRSEHGLVVAKDDHVTLHGRFLPMFGEAFPA